LFLVDVFDESTVQGESDAEPFSAYVRQSVRSAALFAKRRLCPVAGVSFEPLEPDWQEPMARGADYPAFALPRGYRRRSFLGNAAQMRGIRL